MNRKISHTVLSSVETDVKVGLDIEAVRAISGQAQGDASVVVQKLDNTALKGSAAAVIGTRPAVTVRVQDAAGKAITDPSITREEMAVLLVKYADTLGIVLPEVEKAAAFADQNQISAQAVADIRKLQQVGVLEGKTLQTFAPRENLTRADLCTTLRLFLEMMVRGTCRPE